nr:glucans biosynthesis glucosyltransferase MdoH [Sphingobium boeckii]
MVSTSACRSSTPSDLPDGAPLHMPIQSFHKLPMPGRQVVTSPEGMLERRLLLVLGTLAVGLLAASEMGRPLTEDGTSLLDAGLFLLFFSLFCWIAFGFFNAVAGFVVLAGQRGWGAADNAHPPMPRKRTAVLIPVYNEDVTPLFARIRTMTASVGETGAGDMFDFFILSDSGVQAEAAEYAAYREVKHVSPVPLYYRRRLANTARKPGNIAEWVCRFGGGYDYMIVLDADSLMTGRAMMRLASMMDRSPGVGLIQTIPSVINGRTLFARWQQFASAAYGPIASAGQIWWSGAEATFWGHNAILRIRAFADSCGLPELTGPEPFGGHVMSHDMVEAALMRRRGWAAHMIAMVDGSHEEFPPTLSDFAVRDRRWCQGNLQHLRLLGGAGFHWINRLQLLMGASAYLTAPLWSILTMTTLLYMLGLTDPPGFSGWPLLLTGILLFLPKILSLALLMMDRERRERLGGARPIVRSMMFEVPLSILVAPLTMVSQTLSIIDILRGQASGWSAQRRDADGISLRDAARDYRWHMGVGALMFAALATGVDGTIWLVPIMAGLLLSPVIVMVTSRNDIGERLGQSGIFPASDPHAAQASQTVSDEPGFGIRVISNPSKDRCDPAMETPLRQQAV